MTDIPKEWKPIEWTEGDVKCRLAAYCDPGDYEASQADASDLERAGYVPAAQLATLRAELETATRRVAEADANQMQACVALERVKGVLRGSLATAREQRDEALAERDALLARLPHLEEAAELLRLGNSNTLARMNGWYDRDQAQPQPEAEVSPSDDARLDGETASAHHGGAGGGDEDGYNMATGTPTHRDVRNWAKAFSPMLSATALGSLVRYVDQQEAASRDTITKAEHGRALGSLQMRLARAIGMVYEADGRSDSPASWELLIGGASALLAQYERVVAYLKEDRRLHRVRAMELDIERGALKARVAELEAYGATLAQRRQAAEAKSAEASGDLRADLVAALRNVSSVVNQEGSVDAATFSLLLADEIELGAK